MHGSRLILFLTVITTVLGLGLFYLGRRLISGSPLPKSKGRWAWLAFSSLFVLQFVAPTIYRSVAPYAHSGPVLWLQYLNYLALGFLAYLLFLQLGMDLVGGVFKPVSSSRRDWLRQGLVGGGAAVAAASGYAQAANGPRLERVDIPLPRLPEAFDGYKIAQISDLHVGPTIGPEYVRRVVEAVNALEPDAITLTGDMVDGTVLQLRETVALLKELKSKDGVFYITGNHEYFWNADDWMGEFRSHGFHVLDNAHRVVRRGPAQLIVAGLNDTSAGRLAPGQGPDAEAALRGSPDGAVRVMLAHQPTAYKEVEKVGADLQLSGHTHAGQFYPWAFFVQLAFKYVRGLYRHEGPKGAMWVYVNRGTGYWGPPIRTGIPSEITCLTLRRGLA